MFWLMVVVEEARPAYAACWEVKAETVPTAARRETAAVNFIVC